MKGGNVSVEELLGRVASGVLVVVVCNLYKRACAFIEARLRQRKERRSSPKDRRS